MSTTLAMIILFAVGDACSAYAPATATTVATTTPEMHQSLNFSNAKPTFYKTLTQFKIALNVYSVW